MTLRPLLLFIFLLLSNKMQAKYFYEAKSYEAMYVDAELVVEGEWFKNGIKENVIIKKIYKSVPSIKEGDTILIYHFHLYKKPENTKNIFLFLNHNKDLSSFEPIDIQPAMPKAKPFASSGIIWYDSSGCSLFKNQCSSCFLELTKLYKDKAQLQPFYIDELKTKINAFIPHYESFMLSMNSSDSINKGIPCLKYLFWKSTPTQSYYNILSSACVKLQYHNWLSIITEHTDELIFMLKEADDTTDLLNPLRVIKGNDSTAGKYPDKLVPVLYTLLQYNNNRHYDIILILGDKHNKEAVQCLRNLLTAEKKEDRADAALELCWIHDLPSYSKAKTILLASDFPLDITLEALYELSPKKTDHVVNDLLKKYPEGSSEQKEIMRIMQSLKATG